MMNYKVVLRHSDGVEENYTSIANSHEAALMAAVAEVFDTRRPIIFLAEPHLLEPLSDEEVLRRLNNGEAIKGDFIFELRSNMPGMPAYITLETNVTVQVYQVNQHWTFTDAHQPVLVGFILGWTQAKR